MTNIENFLSNVKTGSAEARIASKYKSISDELEKLQTNLLQRIRVAKDSRGRLIPIFQDGVEPLSTELETKDAELKSIRGDIEAYVEACSGPSIDPLLSERAKCRKVLADIDFEVRSATSVAIKKGLAKSAAEAENTPAVIDLLVKKDRIHGEYAPRLAEIEQKIAKAQEILKRY
jgi:hypothetical protein